MNDRADPEVLAYIEAENAYTEKALAHTNTLQDVLYEEIVARVQETDTSASARWAPYEYYTRTLKGSQYSIFCRRLIASPDDVGPPEEQILLDGNLESVGHDFYELGGFAVSPDQRVLAHAADFTGGERLRIRFRDLSTGTELDDTIEDAYYGLAWASDNRTIFYVRVDDTMRPYQVWRHALGTDTRLDVLVHEEPDEHFFTSVARTRSGMYVVIHLESKTTTESLVIRADNPCQEPKVVEPRSHGVEYSIDHHDAPPSNASPIDPGHFFVVTNADGAQNFKLMVCPADTPGRSHWTEVVSHRADVRLDDVDVFADHVVLSERGQGLERLCVLRLGTETDRRSTLTVDAIEAIPMPDPVYSVGLGANIEYDTDTVRYEYTSLTSPASDYDYVLGTGVSTLIKEQPVLGYDAKRFESVRLWATAPDGTRIPLSVVHPRGLILDGSAPCLLYGYGSYEISIDPTFSSTRLSLLERGFVFAIAHVRGGGEMGRGWYEDGKLMNKTNTFNDFIASAEHLIAAGYTKSDRLIARGGSAGGLLMGAVANLRPDLFRAIVAEVPFVDCVTTMLDDSLPLTVTEWEEWGNPLADAETYRVMAAYSPYDNVEAKQYPAMLVTGGLNDPRVQYWEPAKWVAKLRSLKTDARPLLLKMEMGAGHHGPSGRYDAWRDEARVLAFILDQVGTTAAPA